MGRAALLIASLFAASPAFAQTVAGSTARFLHSEPQLQLGPGNFSLPIVEYRAPDGTWKRSNGIIIGHDVSPNTSIGLGFFKMKPKFQDPTLPSVGKSKKVSLGLSMRF